MRDFVLDDGFIQSCIDLPEKIREKIVSQLRALAQDPRNRDLGIARVEGSKHTFTLPVDDTYRILLRREKPMIILLLVTESDSSSVISKRRTGSSPMVVAPVDALETLLVEEKYLLLTKYLLKVPAATRELQFQVAAIEKIVHAHLPPEARRFPNWWANQKSGKRAQAFAWMAAGWLVSKIDTSADLVKFIRRGREVEEAG
jgi:mRNA-degrading endonuclease RelE of RelBE toxin-antitoxin system